MRWVRFQTLLCVDRTNIFSQKSFSHSPVVLRTLTFLCRFDGAARRKRVELGARQVVGAGAAARRSAALHRGGPLPQDEHVLREPPALLPVRVRHGRLRPRGALLRAGVVRALHCQGVAHCACTTLFLVVIHQFWKQQRVFFCCPSCMFTSVLHTFSPLATSGQFLFPTAQFTTFSLRNFGEGCLVCEEMWKMKGKAELRILFLNPKWKKTTNKTFLFSKFVREPLSGMRRDAIDSEQNGRGVWERLSPDLLSRRTADWDRGRRLRQDRPLRRGEHRNLNAPRRRFFVSEYSWKQSHLWMAEPCVLHAEVVFRDASMNISRKWLIAVPRILLWRSSGATVFPFCCSNELYLFSLWLSSSKCRASVIVLTKRFQTTLSRPRKVRRDCFSCKVWRPVSSNLQVPGSQAPLQRWKFTFE